MVNRAVTAIRLGKQIRNPQSEILLMSQPEIFRRCTSCGASFSSGALFCPQCGYATTAAPSSDEHPALDRDDSAANDDDATTAQSESPKLASLYTDEADQTVPVPSGITTKQRIAESPAPLDPAGTSPPTARSRGRSRLAPRNVERRLRPGVDKLRKGTSIVIGEAAYDPSLRFVLVAAVLFLLFLVLLFLSKWIG